MNLTKGAKKLQQEAERQERKDRRLGKRRSAKKKKKTKSRKGRREMAKKDAWESPGGRPLSGRIRKNTGEMDKKTGGGVQKEKQTFETRTQKGEGEGGKSPVGRRRENRRRRAISSRPVHQVGTHRRSSHTGDDGFGGGK